MTISIERSGNGAVDIVVLHGMPSAVSWAQRLIDAMQSEARFFVVHLPGYGSSPVLSPYDWQAVNTRVIETLKIAGVKRPVVVGFSGGARRAFELALDPSLDARAVIGLGATASVSPEERAGFEQVLPMVRNGFDLSPTAGPRFLARATGEAVAVKEVEGWMKATPGSVLADEFETMFREPELLPRLSALKVPVLLRTGSADQSTPPAKAQEIKAAIPQAELEIVDGAGHALLVEDTAETIASIRRFVSSLPG